MTKEIRSIEGNTTCLRAKVPPGKEVTAWKMVMSRKLDVLGWPDR